MERKKNGGQGESNPACEGLGNIFLALDAFSILLFLPQWVNGVRNVGVTSTDIYRR